MTIGCRTIGSRAIGCRVLAPHDPVQGAAVPVRVLYAATAPATTHRFGPYAVDLAMDAPAAPARMRLVVMSHGTGSTPWAMRGLAEHLVDAGFAVALVQHPGNSRDDDALANTVANLENRPRHVRLAIDAAIAALGVQLVPDRVAVIGHSLGGYTALAVAGGKPMALPNQTPDGKAHPLVVEHDARVRAVVLLAPALPWFMAPGALAGVTAAIFARAGERDDLAPPHFVERVLAGAATDYAVVPGAGHFAVFYPVPPHLAALPPGQDPPGFDRAAYQPRLYADVAAFLELQVPADDRR